MRTLLGLLFILLGTVGVLAESCPGNSAAIGTSRVLTVDAKEHLRIGSMQYRETLPLNDKEVVLTFDDGPLPPYTNAVLDTLAAECVKATFFLVGRQARAYPDYVRRIYNAGHTIATHSQNHPLIFTKLTTDKAELEISGGIESVQAALGDPRALAPFFRFPGLGRSNEIESYLSQRGIMTWSADFPADDWRHISAQEVMNRALKRLEAHGKGVLLLHDIQPATALALPRLLAELKSRGYRIVHVQAAGPDRPKTVTEPTQWVMNRARQAWPRLAKVEPLVLDPIAPVTSIDLPYTFAITFGAAPSDKIAAEAQTSEAAWPLAGSVDVITTGSVPPRADGLGLPRLVADAAAPANPRIPTAGDRHKTKTVEKRVTKTQPGSLGRPPAKDAARPRPAPAADAPPADPKAKSAGLFSRLFW